MVGKWESTSKSARTVPGFRSCAPAVGAKPPRQPAATSANATPVMRCLRMSQFLPEQSLRYPLCGGSYIFESRSRNSCNEAAAKRVARVEPTGPASGRPDDKLRETRGRPRRVDNCPGFRCARSGLHPARGSQFLGQKPREPRHEEARVAAGLVERVAPPILSSAPHDA